jgi:hypothetical protein
MPGGWSGYTSYADLCLHRYYGGNTRQSLGAVCIALEPTLWWSRELAFPYEYRSPYFSSDGVERSGLRIYSSLAVIKGLCRRHCRCADPQSPKEDSRLSAWQRLGTRPELKDSDSADSSSDGWSGMSDSEENLPQAFQDRLSNGKILSRCSYARYNR